MPHPYRSPILDHLGLVAGMFDALGLGEGSDRATRHQPDTRIVTTGDAVTAMVVNGRGVVNQPRDLVSRCFQDKPTSRLLAPRLIEATPRNADALGRALETLDASGVTDLYRLMAAPAAARLGLAPQVVHLARTSGPGDGRANRDYAPDAQGVHSTRGDRRDPRPDRHPVRLAGMVAPQAGMPVLMKPWRGNRHDAPAFGQISQDPMAPWPTTDGTTDLVAASALSSEDNLPRRAETRLKWMTRGPATWREAHAALAPAAPQTMAPLLAGCRDRALTSTSAGVAPRWVRRAAAPRRPQAHRTGDKHVRKLRAPAVHACQRLCRTAVAWAADAPQARSSVAHGLQATFLAHSTVRSTARSGQRGRPGADMPPAQLVSLIDAALAARLATRQALVDRQRGCLWATTALDATQLPPPARREGSTGQGPAERGGRVLKAPRVLASSLYLTKPERSMALWMVMTVCWLVDAALESRLRKALPNHGATVPNQPGTPGQHPTARWGFHALGGIHVRLIPGQGPLVLNLTAEPQHVLKLLGTPYERCYR